MPQDATIKTILEQNYQPDVLSEKLREAIPHLNHDQLVSLALYIAMELKLNDKLLWMALQDACLATMHLFDTKQVCQLEWASMQLKPKYTQARFNTLLM